MKRTTFILFCLFSLLFSDLAAQNYIGMHADSIKYYMKSAEKDLHLNTTSVNKYYNYLKYEDNTGVKTVLYFLDDMDNCTYYKCIYDYSLEDEIVEGLNKENEKIGEGLWKEAVSDSMVLIMELKREDWFFSVVTRKKKIENH